MANPTTAWDRVPVYGWWSVRPGVPAGGSILLTVEQRINRVDGRMVYAGGVAENVKIGDELQQDPAIRSQVRQALRTKDEADVVAAGLVFDGVAWDVAWDAAIPAGIFTSYWASDDPDIVQKGYQVKVQEQLTGGAGKVYYVEPLLAMLTLPVPGINLGLIDVPPGAPTAPAPIYAKGLPGGVASLDATGLVPAEQLPPSTGGGASTADAVSFAAAGGIAATTVQAALVELDAEKVAATDARLSDQRTPLGLSVTAAKIGDAAVVGRTINPGAVTDVAVAAANKDGTATVPSMRTLGTGAAQAAAGNDSRIIAGAEAATFVSGYSTLRYPFDPGNSTGGEGRRWVRVLTIDGLNGNAGGYANFLVSGLGNFGVGERGTLLVHAAQHGADLFSVKAWSWNVEATAEPVEIHSKQVSTYVFEVWLRLASYNQTHELHLLAASRAVVNLDNIVTVAPTPIVNWPWKSMVTGDDGRLSDARTPLGHTHPASALTATGTRDATTYLRGDNTWTTPAGGTTSPDATPTVKGIVQLAGDLGGTALVPTVPGLAQKVALLGDQSVAGVKTFAVSPLVPDPVAPTAVANRDFVEERINVAVPPDQSMVYKAVGDDSNLSAALASAPANAVFVAVKVFGS